MAGLYSYYLAPLVLTPAQVNTPQLVNTGNRLGGWLLIQNNSPYKIQVQLPGSGNVLPLDPQTVDKLQVNAGDQQVYILPLLLLPGAAPSSQVDIQVYPGDENEPPGTYPMALPRQATSIGPESTAAGFSFDFLASIASNGVQALKFANTSTTKNLTFYLLIISTTQATSSTPDVEIGWINNTTALASGPFTASSNNGTLSATSFAQITTQQTSLNTLTQPFIIALMQPGVPFNLIPYPDKKLIPPGASLGINIANGLNAATWFGGVAWTEQ